MEKRKIIQMGEMVKMVKKSKSKNKNKEKCKKSKNRIRKCFNSVMGLQGLSLCLPLQYKFSQKRKID
jgi:hypothetical protein